MALWTNAQNKSREATAALQGRFDSKPANDEQSQFHDRLRSMYKAVVKEINDEVVDSAEKTLAIRDLETSFMWMGKAIFQPPSEPEVVTQSLTKEMEPHNIMWDGTKSPFFEKWLGDDFVSWGNRNVSGQVNDEVILSVMVSGVLTDIPKWSHLWRSETGMLMWLHND